MMWGMDSQPEVMEESDVDGPMRGAPSAEDKQAQEAKAREAEPQGVKPREAQAQGVAEVQQGLSQRERAMLDFEARWWRQPSAKQEQIRRQFSIPPLAYFQQLNALISRPEALTYDPVTVRRLLRKRGDGA